MSHIPTYFVRNFRDAACLDVLAEVAYSFVYKKCFQFFSKTYNYQKWHQIVQLYSYKEIDFIINNSEIFTSNRLTRNTGVKIMKEILSIQKSYPFHVHQFFIKSTHKELILNLFVQSEGVELQIKEYCKINLKRWCSLHIVKRLLQKL